MALCDQAVPTTHLRRRDLARRHAGHVTLLLILAGLLAWCVVPLPLAVVVGRAIGARGADPEGTGRQGFDLAA